MWALVREPSDETVIQSAVTRPPPSHIRGRWVLAATILASSMAFIDSTVVNVALPALQSNLGATAVDVQWVVEAYSLLLSAFLLVGGSLGDHHGRRRIFVIGITVFALASIACGCATGTRQLIAARALQGLGAALVVPGSLALISSSFAQAERGRAIGTWSGASAITTAIGPLIGGWLIEHVSWRAVFFINVPVAVAAIVISLLHVAEYRDRERTRVDWLGASLAAGGLGALVYGLLESAQRGFADRAVVLVLVVAGVLIAGFLWHEGGTPAPMLPLSLFRSRSFAGANLLTFLLYAALGGTLFFLPLNLIQVQHYSATAAGAALLPFILIISLLSRWSGGLVTKHGPKIPLTLGPLIAAAGFALFTLFGPNENYWATFFPPIAVLGLGMAISVAPLTTTVMNSVAQKHVGVASGVNNAVARSAGLIAIAVMGTVMLHLFHHQLNSRLSAAMVPRSAAEVVDAQYARLGAIVIPGGESRATQELLRNSIRQSFISAFQTLMFIGAALASASALVGLLFIQPTARLNLGKD